MRFYVPDWDDHVDADYDFVYDVHSRVENGKRENLFLWDIFGDDELPADGLLLSRDSVTKSPGLKKRLYEHGIYDDPRLDMPDWLPTISDCGAWGYRKLPFPPYSRSELLDFYERIGVTTGVTLDHVAWKGPDHARLYLNENAFDDVFTPDDLPESLLGGSEAEVFITEWPSKWPENVSEYEPSIYDAPEAHLNPFRAEDFEGSVGEICSQLRDDPRAVYRPNDNEFRQHLTLENAEAMLEQYDPDRHDFRLMGAVQGWDPESYADAAAATLDYGFDYIGLGGLAGASQETIENVVSSVGEEIVAYELEYQTRVDAHVFGFAKSGAFDTIRDAGITSFDSASMLIAAWTGGKNYHLTEDRRYDALRVRYPKSTESRPRQIEKAVRAQEILRALRAYDAGEPIVEAVEQFYDEAEDTLRKTVAYLKEHRHEDGYQHGKLTPIKKYFRRNFSLAAEFKGTVGEPVWRELMHLLREDNPEDTEAFARYERLLEPVEKTIQWRRTEHNMYGGSLGEPEAGSLQELNPLLEEYASFVEDDDNLDNYRKLLEDRPWEECDCPLCEKHGIEVAIWRGNNRNRRRGFHNMYRFSREMAKDFPEILILAPVTGSGSDRCEDAIQEANPELWDAVHGAAAIEIAGEFSGGIYEWWERLTASEGNSPEAVAAQFDTVLAYDPDGALNTLEALRTTGCEVETYEDPEAVDEAVKNRLGSLEQSGLTEFQ
ncbi:queuine tRNA-ribosyltransferase tRNA-guanine transglycosylase [Halobacterium bonnevillei]|uniref:Queuine tRNA-ribosyltransferase tRNA-guanine transglycosylase n=1 Tax=Halobacterium bonnevillei TaxID=2692200 RepID=A0A6B0SN79_9EURY|nr:queuine tRNA-ribosyltransferase tRNA-guanine transglycosylase [Halobacterium bonnevillei]MXR20300.1 queuine tRNA-ribosyltransferase tRNA-guanine transglycosylase [Halobacterium bonnevillei]